jgi:phage anti-repressor protein|tara:strand:- start:1155 stop:1757 length:603 start_codon:yes stop_codon:yes gene_type:complete
MKIDIQDIKFWADAIRNSADRDRTLESLWGGQLQSKSWLIEKMENRAHIANADIVIFGGWNGILASMMFNSDLGTKHITSIDIDPACEKIASTVNKRQEMAGRFKAVTEDMCKYEYTTDPYFVINTSCEHVTPTQYKTWLDRVPKGTKVILQSNNYYELDEHVNCVSSLEEFKKTCNIDIDAAHELELPKYKRFMIIGNV